MSYRYAFTEAELYAALRSVLPDEDARELASTGAADVAEGGALTFSEETLVLLSLLGPETNRKVEHYRSWRRQGQPISAEEERQWQTIKEAMDAHIAASRDVGDSS
jgi:hypothetical protein